MPKTPYFIFDIDKLKKRAALMREKAERAGVGLCYAIKANAFITKYFLDYTDGFEVCSHGELEICKKQGIPMERIILSGVNKEEAFVEDGILSQVGVITAESALHFEYIKKYAGIHKRNVKIILRLSNGAQFGMDREVLKDIIAHRKEYDYITIEGIHYFTGTQKKKAKKIIEELEFICGFADSLKTELGYDANLIEYGPGLAVPYFQGDDFENDMLLYEEVLDWISQNQPGPRINLEMGRFFAASCGTYVTSVADVKINDGLNVCIIDGGKNHLSYYGQNMALKTPIIRQRKAASLNNTGGKVDKWTVFGSLCSFNDIIARDVELEDLSVGDELLFENVGAYSVTEGLSLFLSRSMPQVWIVENGNKVKIRDIIETFTMNG